MLFREWRALPEERNYTPAKALRWRWRNWFGDIRRTTTYKLLQRIEAACGQIDGESSGAHHARNRLMQFRCELRPLLAGFDSRCNDGEVDIVRYYLLTCPRSMIAICVWLMSRFSDRMHLYEIKTFRDDVSPNIRRHVAKALRRLEAWPSLRDMADANRGDSRIQWYATAPTAHLPFAKRLQRFTFNIDDSHADEVATPSRMPYWAQDDFWTLTPPKSVLFIRRMLRRIRHLVRWGVS
jgi:hypothetical protein